MPSLRPLIFHNIPGDYRRYRVSEDWAYQGRYQEFHIPKGFTTDLASVPRLFWSLIAPHGKHLEAAVLHDYLYTEKPRIYHRGVSEQVSRKDADGIFRRALREAGVGYFKRRAMYLAVRAFGGKAWQS